MSSVSCEGNDEGLYPALAVEPCICRLGITLGHELTLSDLFGSLIGGLGSLSFPICVHVPIISLYFRAVPSDYVAILQ